jgi:hypothetical protein
MRHYIHNHQTNVDSRRVITAERRGTATGEPRHHDLAKSARGARARRRDAGGVVRSVRVPDWLSLERVGRRAYREAAAIIVKVDSHIHLWDERHTPQPWLSADDTAIARPFGPSDIMPLLERNGVDAVILVQGACLDSDTDYLVDEAARNDWIGALTAWVCLEDPDRAAHRLDELASSPKLRAIRHLSHNEPDHWLTRPAVLESIAIVDERDLISRSRWYSRVTSTTL